MTKWNRMATTVRNWIHPIVLLLTKTRVKYRITMGETPVLLPGKPVIFAVNHTNSFDAPIASKAISICYHRHCYILVGKQPLYLSDRFFFFLNGVFWVDRKNKQEMAEAKNKLINYLKGNQAIMWYPEGTWNLTDNLLMLPMKWGIINVAAKAGAQIVPVVLDYDRQTMICHVSFGVPMAPDENTDKAEAIRDLRDTMATLRWIQWERREPLRRDEIDPEALRKEMFIALEEYPPIDWENEQTIIFNPYVTSKDAFSHLEHLIPCRENAFLFK